VFSGDIPNAQTFAFAPSAGFHYTFAANSSKTIILSPEFLASYNIIPSIKNYQWNILAWRFGCAITFNNEKKIDSQLQYDIKKQTPIVSKPIIPACDAFIKGIDSTGKQFDISTITIKETEINRLQPLLPFVFFDEDSFTIPSRYRLLQEHETSTFDINALTSQSKLEVYWSLLDIIGYRLQKNPTATITLTGCNSHIRNEKNNIDLSRKRAEHIRLYLHTIWHIPLERCSLSARNLPQNASVSHAGYEQDIIDAQQENRRVEISSDNFSILEPVHISAKIVTINPESILYSFPEYNGDSIINRNIELKTDNGQLIHQTISGNIANFKAHLSGIATQLSKQNDDNLISTLTMYDAQQMKCKTDLKIPIKRITQIEHKHNDTMYNEYSLVLFPFNASTIEQNNKKIISLIKSELNPGASISIAGFTDRVGVYNHNKTLSYNRALAVYKALDITSDLYSINPLTDIVGYGEQDVHELPEGRLYWRTVNIFVKNPLSKP
jgi:outer membrane protein OmpA-like peptidoglycan-associated protein